MVLTTFFKEDLTLHYFLPGMFVCNSFLQHTIFLAILLLAKIKINGFFFRLSDLLCKTATTGFENIVNIKYVFHRRWAKYFYLENKRCKKFSHEKMKNNIPSNNWCKKCLLHTNIWPIDFNIQVFIYWLYPFNLMDFGSNHLSVKFSCKQFCHSH